MKHFILYITYSFSLLFGACNTKETTSHTTEAPPLISNTLEATIITPDKKSLLKEGSMFFVIAKKRTLLYDEPNTKTTSIGTLVDGMPVQLMTVKNDFAIVNAYIHRTSVKNGKTLESYMWENVYTPITNLGNRDELQILEELVYQSLENDNTSEFSKITAISALKKYLTIQIVSEKDFNEALKNKSSDWIDYKPRFKKETKNS